MALAPYQRGDGNNFPYDGLCRKATEIYNGTYIINAKASGHKTQG